jgi:hypothetical protein
VPDRRAWTVVERAVLTVGAAAIGIQAAVIEFRLLVNVELEEVVLRDQPSGTLSWKCPAALR